MATASDIESSRERHYRKLKIYIPDADDSVADHLHRVHRLRRPHVSSTITTSSTGTSPATSGTYPSSPPAPTSFFPAGASGIRANTYTGAYRSAAETPTTEIAGNGVEVHTTAPLSIHAGLTVAVAFDKGLIHEPSALPSSAASSRSNWPLFLPLFVFALMFYLWWTRGRDPRLRPIAAQYEPPNQLTPGEVGTLMDNSVDMRDITASIVDLAVRGYMVIEEHQKDRMLGLLHDKEYSFILQKDRAQWSTLKPHEQALLNGFFSAGTTGETISMDSLQNRFYKNLPDIKSRIFDSLVGQGFYRRRPDSVRSAYVGTAIVVGAISIWGGSALASALGMASLPFIVGGILSAAIICAFGWFMPAHTEQGARVLENVLGFEDFLNHVESDRFNRTIKTPEMFEKFLPFAMAFGVEKNWSNAFQGIMTRASRAGIAAAPARFFTRYISPIT